LHKNTVFLDILYIFMYVSRMNYVAFKMLVGDTAKYIGIVVGITFAALIMTQQPSIFVGLMSRTYSFIANIGYPDLWVMDPKVRYVDDTKPLQDTELLRVRGVPGVKWAVPLYKGNVRARTPEGNFQNCMMVGIDDSTLIGGPGKMLAGKLSDLRRADGIIADIDGAKKFLAQTNPDGTKRPLQVGDVLEINDKRAVVVGISQTNLTFQRQPLLYTTYSRAMAYSPAERLKLSFILAGIQQGADVQTVKNNITKHTGLEARTKEEFQKMTLNYVMENTGIPINFGTSVLLGFLVGAAIAGQMFFSFTHDNIKQFGALKAMGLSNWRLVKMIMFQGLFVGATGWGLGVGLAALFGYSTSGSVLAFSMVWQILALSAAGVTIIIIIAALISIRKVVKLEPAIVFK
jgi:putative ABC transport system permease protein